MQQPEPVADQDFFLAVIGNDGLPAGKGDRVKGGHLYLLAGFCQFVQQVAPVVDGEQGRLGQDNRVLDGCLAGIEQ